MQRMPITIDSIHYVVSNTGFTVDEDRPHDQSCTYRGIARRMGYDEENDRVHALIKSMTVSGFIRQNGLGAFHIGPTPLPTQRQRDIAADRAFAARLDASAAAGNLTTHEPGDACSLGLWHEGRCPDRRLEEALRADDMAEDRGNITPQERVTCGVHRCLARDCATDPFHTTQDDAVMQLWRQLKAADDSPEARLIHRQVEMIRLKNRPLPHENPWTGRLDREDVLPLDGERNISMTQLAEGDRHIADGYHEKWRKNHNPEDLDQAMFFHALADLLETYIREMEQDHEEARPAPAGVPPGVTRKFTKARGPGPAEQDKT
jgi:hypothetical protein